MSLEKTDRERVLVGIVSWQVLHVSVSNLMA
jgi:hypothetical protein